MDELDANNTRVLAKGESRLKKSLSSSFIVQNLNEKFTEMKRIRHKNRLIKSEQKAAAAGARVSESSSSSRENIGASFETGKKKKSTSKQQAKQIDWSNPY